MSSKKSAIIVLFSLSSVLLWSCGEQATKTIAASMKATLHMANSDVLQGTLALDQFSIQTPYADINVPVHAVTSIDKSKQQSAVMLHLAGGGQFSGVFNNDELALEQANGNSLTVITKQINKIELESSAPVTAAELSGHDVLLMQNTDLFAAKVTTSEFVVVTDYAELKMATATLERIEVESKSGADLIVEAVFKDNKGVVSGRLLTSEIKLETSFGQALTLTPVDIHTLAIAATPAVVSALRQQVAADLADKDTQSATEETVIQDKLVDSSLGPALVVIPAGTFMMGSPEGESGRRKNETLHEVTIRKPFAVGKYEVTFAEYNRFAEETEREKPYDQDWGGGQRPVINVSAHDATAYAAWLSEQTGQSYRLLTEAEWEYVARAGTKTAYWWGDSVGDDNAVCKECGSKSSAKTTLPVGSLQANPFGVYDILGNVWEWTCSHFARSYNGAELQCAAVSDEELRAIRGGAYLNPAAAVRSAARDSFSPADSNELVGFRLARDL